LADLTPLTKVLVRADPESPTAARLSCQFGRSKRTDARELVLGSGPDEWLILAPAGRELAAVARLATPEPAPETGEGELVSVIDVTHGRVVLRLSGKDAVATLEKICAIDLSDLATPDGAVFCSSVARLTCVVARDDVDGLRSYLIVSDRSSGQYLFDVIADAGAEFSLSVDGYPLRSSRLT
jgi:heterotetrameric sarcosine oxidase gamma subunit